MKTRAAIFRGVGQPVDVCEIDLREPRAGEVLVRMAAVGICGTDLHIVRGEWDRPVPMVLGHEGAGVVEAVGEGVVGLTPGTRVVLSWAPGCGHCADCARSRPAACAALQDAIKGGTLPDGTTGLELDGETVYRGTATGALAERVVVDASVALPLHDDVDLVDAALLGCAALTGVGAVLFQARPAPGASVLVIGAGAVGLFATQAARIAGAHQIVVVDLSRERLLQASELGATATAAPDEAAALVAELTGAGVDVAIDAVGLSSTTQQAVQLLRNGGRAVVVGLPPAGVRLDLDPAEFVRREKELTGSMYGSEDPREALPILIDHVRSGRLKLAPLVGPRYPLDAVDRAFEHSLAAPPGRVVVELG